jgi:type II secretory pathway predicted ATPase ExeA
MHDGCFGLTRRPFSAVPQVDDYFPAEAMENARTSLARCIQRGEGTGLVVGPSGTGKTLLCLMLAQQFQRSFRVAMLPSGRLGTRRALFQAILYDLGRPYRGMDEGELRLAVVDDVMSGEVSSSGLVLLVDEAHVLPMRLLEELRLLTNLARGDQPLVRLVLAGGSVLEERFASPKLDSFNQRLAARCYLNAFNCAETQAYICHQIARSGGQAEALFCEETCRAVFQATGGVPRLINQVCDHAMLLSYVAGRQHVSPADIEEAWADLQQLPTPWNGETKTQSDSGVIEFGSLDDSAEEAVTTRASTASAGVAVPALRISPVLEEADSDGHEPAQQIHRIEQLLAEAEDDFQPAGSIVPEIELHFEGRAHPFSEEFEHEEVISDRYAIAGRFAKGPAQAAVGFDSARCEPIAATPELVASSQLSKGEQQSSGNSKERPATTDREPCVGPPASQEPVAPARRPEFRHLFARLRRG